MERVAVLVEILHLPLVEDRALDVVLGAQLLVGKRPGADVPHLRLDESAHVTGREMLQIEDAEQVVPHLDQHALLHPCRLYGAHTTFSCDAHATTPQPPEIV